MKIWKMLGLNTRETRENMNQDNNRASVQRTQNTNWHSTIQWVVICLACVAGIYFLSR